MIAENVGPGEEELRDSFHALRREEQRSVPVFPAPGSLALMRERRRGVRRRSQAWALAGCACAAMLIATVLIRRPNPSRAHPSHRVPVASITQWRPPTEFLLETPGRAMLHTTPVLEMPPSLGPVGPHRRQQSRNPAQTEPSGPR